MSLQVWLPLNGDLHNQGCSDVTVTNHGATVNTNGKIGSCYHFGTASQYMNISKEAMNTFTTECSIAFWLKIKSWNTSYATYFQAGLGGTAWAHYIFGFLRNNANSTVCFTISNGSRASNASYLTSSLSLDTWYHVVLTYTTGKCTIYLNGALDHEYTTSIVPNFAGITTITLGKCNNGSSYQTDCDINDFRIYDHALSAAEVKEISQGLILHYKLDGIDIPNENLGNTSADYHNFSDGYTKAAGSWGGDAGTVTFHHSGGYAGLPYKELHKTATGTGGIYSKTADDIVLEANTTYTMSCWIKSSRNFRPIHYSFNINRGVGNVYITYGNSFDLTTEWQFFSKTFTTTEDQAGSYGEMSIIYDDDVTDYYIYYSGFKIEKGTIATRWTPPGIQYTTIQDSSGYNNNATLNTTTSINTSNGRYNSATYFGAYNAPVATLNTPEILPALTNCTITYWAKYDTTKTLLLTGHTTSHYLMASDNNNYYHQNAGTLTIYRDGVQGTYKCTANEWHFFAITGVNLSAWTTMKINGYGSGWPLKGILSDFRIYATQLSQDSIRQLYEVSAKVDNKQNLHTFELVENNSKIQITKQGQIKCNELEEDEQTKFYQTDQIIETNEIIEL